MKQAFKFYRNKSFKYSKTLKYNHVFLQFLNDLELFRFIEFIKFNEFCKLNDNYAENMQSSLSEVCMIDSKNQKKMNQLFLLHE